MKAAHNEHLFIEDVKRGYFRIDNKGRIWRIAIKGWKKPFIRIQERELKNINNRGYIRITFDKNKKIYTCLAHRLVWIYFNGSIPDDKQINHINGIKADNRPVNLELITGSENINHSFVFLGRKARDMRGEKHPQVKLKENDVKEIRLRYSCGEIQREIAKDFDITRSQVSSIAIKRTWAHIK